jgi:CheY-like chemotaxis protein
MVTMAGSNPSDAIRVLLVEDDPEFAEMYRLRLEADEYVVEWARNGQEGLRLVHAWHPQLIFLDVRMPEMDGLQLLHLLRDDPATAGVPVVVLTNYDDEALQREGEGLGILDWRSKIDTTPGGMSAYVRRWSSAAAEDAETS